MEEHCSGVGNTFVPSIRVRMNSPYVSLLMLMSIFRDGPPPYAVVSLTSMLAQQPYDISLHLVVPSIEANYALGNFMSTLTLSTPTNQTLMTIRRPVSTSISLRIHVMNYYSTIGSHSTKFSVEHLRIPHSRYCNS